ncbi:hypothetical protein K504DRAFT_371777 [Pleomassaria siparia CBS 279.74]|uniref:Uncharacterized protein n=1 Tax=Pleomassaria siparia CBS 279.74 TaxID=1314801 RepID=A0A6G1KI72_9PLEO|nr:hypothetical protein K504DRAFT_371777 [Pleomassaria siparia CBS 279.74]
MGHDGSWLPNPFFQPVDHPVRHQPAEYFEGVGWFQNGHRRHRVKPHKHFIWPKDGQRGSTLGRWKDILQGKGPDIHIALSADKMDYMWNRQRRTRWGRHTNLDDGGPDGSLRYELPWIGRSGTDTCYDFRTRKYGKPNRNMWTDALWPEERNWAYPYAMKNVKGEWAQYSPNFFNP